MGVESLGLQAVVRESLDRHLSEIEGDLGRDVLAVYGPILAGLETRVRYAIEGLDTRKDNLVVILDTPGGIVEVVERIVETVRHFYSDVAFLIPDRAMSAGTILAMSGDSIMMDYFSRLGPIDPQVWKDDHFVPALSYLIQYERLIQKDRKGELTTAEFTLLSKFDLAELHQFEQARELSISLLVKWLATYKFKNWKETETQRQIVTPEVRAERARQIARALSDNELWHSHGRGISRATLESDTIGLKIDDIGGRTTLQQSVRKYHHCLTEFMGTIKMASLVHSRCYF